MLEVVSFKTEYTMGQAKEQLPVSSIYLCIIKSIHILRESSHLSFSPYCVLYHKYVIGCQHHRQSSEVPVVLPHFSPAHRQGPPTQCKPNV